MQHRASKMEPNKHTSLPDRSGADDLRAKTLELLDFPAIRKEVASRTSFPPARELARRLAPSSDSREVDVLQRETAQGIDFLEAAGDLSLHASEDASPAVERAALEGALTGLELLSVADSLDVQRRARSAVLRLRDSVPILTDIVEGIPDLQSVQRRIRECIGSRGEVLDGATPVLGELRRQSREAYARVTEALDHIIHSALGREVLQDQVISIRGERLVVQVKTELRQRVPGIVLDASNTGATLFIEPFATVDLCNAWRELTLEEERETALVLRDLSAQVGAAAPDIERGVHLTARLDFILARARYSATLRGVAAEAPPGSAQSPPDGGHAVVRLIRARHPLLGADAIPISIHIGPGWSVLVVTGPNTGGKTVAMKTLGLLALMHQSGLHIPADHGSSLPVFDGIYADVGDQQSIAQSVSTFGSHMRNVVEILARATPASLVLLDELGTSTDPEEGSALAKAILGHLAARGVAAVATTHHRTVAAHVETASGMMNASVDLDPSTLTPTYHLTLGVPGRSYAMSVAAQLGLPDAILEGARSLLEPQHLRFEDWLNELQGDRQRLKARLQEADETQSRAEATGRELDARLEEIALRREDMLQDMRRQLAEQFDEVRRKLRRAEASLSWRVFSSEAVAAGDVEKARVEVSTARTEVEELERSVPIRPPAPERHPLAVGDAVDVRGLNVRGTVVSIMRQDNEAEVAVGDVRFRLDMGRLSPAQEQDEDGPAPAESPYEARPGPPTAELDLRGLRLHESLERLDVFLDDALVQACQRVRIIHGKGTGTLRQGVWKHLANHPAVERYDFAEARQGGDGATVVELG